MTFAKLRAASMLAATAMAACAGPALASTTDGDFGAVRAALHAKTTVPLYYPESSVLHRELALPSSTIVWSVLARASTTGYDVAFSKVRGCYTSTPCKYGSLSVSRIERRAEDGATQKVALAANTVGAYQPPHDTNVSDGVVTWKRNGLFFILEIVEGRTPSIAHVADSIIEHGAWK